ncbi:putative membrane protein [Streptosporangium becharense]|uniref:Putative membrane protein n=1 Tax=Streptosporangium becharense TaxID=1816182 RepID=A0A7W9INA1_9ACTN|nr:AmiS/UreI family transporter [Streptosporangium becharense]MBB2910510.1 putative membrane protein [Streptosporangium becharense]MBB5823253.1 putative membrane protein [Streptosporangium becharense]
MGSVGLLYVGAVLFINGLMLLGKVEARSAGIFNLFVGALQVIVPTVLIITSGGRTEAVLGASGIYLFGFTYLYVGIGLLGGFDTTGVGYFSLFVAVMALGYAFVNFQLLNDRPFGVIWLYWSFLWFLFFLLLGLKHDHLTTYTGWVTAIQGWVTAALPSFLLLSGYWQNWNQNLIATVLAVFGVVVFGVLWALTGKRGTAATRAGRAGGETLAAH